MNRFDGFLVFPTLAAAKARANALRTERITPEVLATGTTDYTEPMELDDWKWALQVQTDVPNESATRAASVVRKPNPDDIFTR
jgi:hypothetical protein